MSRKNTEHGFSLLELVVVVAMLTVVMGAAFQLLTRSQISFDANQTLAEAHANADYAVIRVTEIVRGAGANPGNVPTINPLAYIVNPGGDETVVRIWADFNGDGDTSDPVDSDNFHILTSEDVTIRWYDTAQTVAGVEVPAYSLALVDNTPDPATGVVSGAPVVLATNIREFSCVPVGSPVREAVLRVTGGSSRETDPDNPRYREFTRTMQIRLRTFN